MLGGLASSRLDKILVRDEKLAVGVSAGLIAAAARRHLHGQRVGAGRASIRRWSSKRLDEIMADYIAKGPTEDEVQRAVMSEVSGRIRGLEQVGGFGGKAVTLAEGQTFAGDSNFYKKTLASYAAITPAAVRAAMQQWLHAAGADHHARRPASATAYAEAKSGRAAQAAAATRPPARSRATAPLPPVGQLAALDFPDIVHTKLSNGIPVDYVAAHGGPGDPGRAGVRRRQRRRRPQARGLAAMTMDLLDEGTATLSSQQFAEAEERLGADVSTGNGADRSYVMLTRCRRTSRRRSTC